MPDVLHENPDALPQPIGEYRPVDEWQARINAVFYALRGGRLQDFYQTFASADYRLAHALATDYYDRVLQREKASGVKRDAPCQDAPITHHASPLTILELGAGNGNLAACFLSHLKRLDSEGRVYPRLRYVLADRRPETLATAKAHPDLADHLAKVEFLLAPAESLPGLADGSVDRILCNELWNELPTKLMLRNQGEVEEEFVRPNLSEKGQAAIADWSGFVRAFDEQDLDALRRFPPPLEEIVWEKEYRKTEWKSVPYRKTITEFLKRMDEKVLVPVNLGAFATLKEARRLLAPDAVGLSGFDAGAADPDVLNDPEKPCYGQFGGQFSFIVNFLLLGAVAEHLGFKTVEVEPQREFVGRSLGTNVLSLPELLAAHPSAASLQPWEQDRLALRTIRTLNETYTSPYQRTIEFPIKEQAPLEEQAALRHLLSSLRRDGLPDTVAYVTEDEIFQAMRGLETLGYERETIRAALQAPANAVEYFHSWCRPS